MISNWGGVRKLPYAFTVQGLATLSGILNSDIAIQVNINIMRVSVAVRQLSAIPPVDRIGSIDKEVKELKAYVEEAFADYNDINDDTVCNWNSSIKRLQSCNHKRSWTINPAPIGFVKPEK